MHQDAARRSVLTPALLVAGFVGLAVLMVTWWVGPTVFATGGGDERVVTATVTKTAPCDAADPLEQVRLSDGGGQRDAALPACGHGVGEEVEVAVPHAAGAGQLTVRVADTTAGLDTARRSLGLLLIALSCLAGGAYAFVMLGNRAPRTVSPQG